MGSGDRRNSTAGCRSQAEGMMIEGCGLRVGLRVEGCVWVVGCKRGDYIVWVANGVRPNPQATVYRVYTVRCAIYSSKYKILQHTCVCLK